MKWITRERVKVDRVACPWLIRKFVDKQAEFFFVPADKVMDEAQRLGCHPLRCQGRGTRAPRQGVFVRGDLEKVQPLRRPCARTAR